MTTTSTYHGLDWLCEHLSFVVPLRMWEIDGRARRLTGASDGPDYEAKVRELGQAVDPRHITRRARGGLTPDRINALTGAPIADTNAGIVATQGDTLLGSSKPGSVTVVVAALTSILAMGALIEPDGVTYHGHHFCRGHCRDQTHKEAA